MSRVTDFDSERGATLILVAASLVALFGFAALAVDVSGFYQTARAGQTTADFACLAGVSEIDQGDDAAIDMAHEYAKANWAEAAGMSLPANSNPRTASDGNGNVIYYEAGYGGDDDVLYVKVTDRDATTFGRAVGATDVDVVQEAACALEVNLGGPGAMPMGALPGTFDGLLHNCENKTTGNCGALDVGSGGSAWRDAIGSGWDQQLEKHHGLETATDPQTGHSVIFCPSGGPCSANDTETGNMQGPFRQGLGTRFGVPGVNCTLGPPDFNCDTIVDVFGSMPMQLEDNPEGDPPGWWHDSLYGSYSAATARTNHYYFDGDIKHCDSPRLGLIPIVWAPKKKHDPLDWDIGDPRNTWPNGKGTMKVIGFYTVFLREPNTPGELGSGPIEADIVYIGPGATCDGEAFNLWQTGIPIESVRLVQP